MLIEKPTNFDLSATSNARNPPVFELNLAARSLCFAPNFKKLFKWRNLNYFMSFLAAILRVMNFTHLLFNTS